MRRRPISAYLAALALIWQGLAAAWAPAFAAPAERFDPLHEICLSAGSAAPADSEAPEPPRKKPPCPFCPPGVAGGIALEAAGARLPMPLRATAARLAGYSDTAVAARTHGPAQARAPPSV